MGALHDSSGLQSRLSQRRSTLFFDSCADLSSSEDSELGGPPVAPVSQLEALEALDQLEEFGELDGDRRLKAPLQSHHSCRPIPPVDADAIPQPDCLRADVPSKFGRLSLTQTVEGATFFITGGTGFVGSVVVEQLLRLFPGQVKKIYLLVRQKRGQSPEERLDALFTRKALFASHLVEGKLPAELRSKVVAVAGDTTLEGLGISPADRRTLEEEVNFVIHSAASISFFDHIHILLQQNYYATEKVLQLAAGCHRLRGFIHVSTAYVNSNLPRGSHIEEHIYPLKRKGRVVAHDKTAAQLQALPPAKAEKEAQQLIKDLGLPNGYTLTKHWAEDLLAEAHGPAFPVAIVRPSIIGALAGGPLPGYFGNAAGLTSVTLAFATGMACFTCHNPFSVYDVIPCDLVGHTILASCALLTEPSAGARPPTVLHSCSSTSHPMSYVDSVRRIVLPYWSHAPPTHRLVKSYSSFDDRFTWVEYGSTLFKMLTAQANLRVGAAAMAVRLSGRKRVAEVIESSWNVWKLYNTPTMDFELFYCCRVLRQLEAALDPAERSALGLKLVWTKDDDWNPYLMVWQETIRKKYHPDTMEKAKGWTYSTEPTPQAELAKEEWMRARGPERLRSFFKQRPSTRPGTGTGSGSGSGRRKKLSLFSFKARQQQQQQQQQDGCPEQIETTK